MLKCCVKIPFVVDYLTIADNIGTKNSLSAKKLYDLIIEFFFLYSYHGVFSQNKHSSGKIVNSNVHLKKIVA